MNTEEVKSAIEGGRGDALDLLLENCPKAYDAFHKHANALAKVLAGVRKQFPDAVYYTSGGDGFALLLGSSHGDHEEPNTELQATQSVKLKVQGGDW
ncbi:hypothetical protein ACI51Z_09235 [Pectobacterium carotovorum]|uniref:hypothetical protein n=1 Tax=Pectobacterium carotovorum TaxID=554 RepID=UPI00386973AD